MIRKIKRSVLVLMLLNILLSCRANVDIADKVDERIPLVRITYPQEECPVIRNSFTLKGIAKDDGKIDNVIVTLTSDCAELNEKEEYTCSLEQKSNSCDWKIELNVPSENDGYPLRDGKYCATVVATDANGKKGKTTFSFIIDNTPPLLFLHGNHCESIEDYTGILNLGTDLNFRGIAYDESGSMQIEVFVYDKENCHTKIVNVDGEFDVKIDGFFSNLQNDGFYRRLYGNKIDAGNKSFRYAIKITDSAKEYASPTSQGEANRGNCSKDFYFYEPLDSALYKSKKDSLIFPKYNVQDLYKMISYPHDIRGDIDKEAEKLTQLLANGTTEEGIYFKFSAPPINQPQKSKTSNSESTNDSSLYENSLLSLPILVLNPLDSPKFEVLDTLALTIDFTKKDELTSNKMLNVKTLKKSGDVLNIKLSPFSDNVLLEDSSNFEFYYYPLSNLLQDYETNASIFDIYQRNSREETSDEFSNQMSKLIKIENVAIKKEDNSFLATFSIDNVQKEESKENAQKEDTKNGNISSSDSSNANLPTRSSSDQDSSTSSKEKSEHSANKDSAKEENKTTEASMQDISKETTLKAGETYLIIVKGKDLNGNPFIPVHTKEITSLGYIGYAFKIEEVISKSEENKKDMGDDGTLQLLIDETPQLVTSFPQINGKIFDGQTGFEKKDFHCKVSYNNGDKFDVPIEWLDNEKKGEWKLGKFTNTKEGSYQLFFNAKDKNDNTILERVLKIVLDKDKPMLVGINDLSVDAIKEGQKLELKYFQDVHNISIGGEIRESNGLQEIKIGLKNVFEENNNKTFQTLPFKLISANEGKYSFLTSFDFKKEGEDVLILRIIDIAGRVSVYELPFVVDKTSKHKLNAEKSSQEEKYTPKIIDTFPPSIKFLIPSNAVLLFNTSKNTSKILVKAEDVGNFNSGIKEVRWSKTASFNTFSIMDKVEGNFEAELKNIHNDTIYYFMAVDNADNFSEIIELQVKVVKEQTIEPPTNPSPNKEDKKKKIDVAPQVPINENIYTSSSFTFDNIFYSITPTFPFSPQINAKIDTQINGNTILSTQNKKLLSFRAQVKAGKDIIKGKLTISSPQGHSKTYNALISHDTDRNGFYILDFNDVDSLSIGEGCRMLEFEVEDSSSLKASETKVVILDFTPPAIDMLPTKICAGNTYIRGTLIDKNPIAKNIAVSGVDEMSLEYKIGNSPFMNEHKVNDIVLSKIENSVAIWKIDIPNIAEYSSSKYGAIKINDSTWSLPLQIRVRDRAGNEATSEIYKIRFQMKK